MIPLGILASATGSASPPAESSAWDPDVKGAHIVLSNEDRDAETGAVGWSSVYGSRGRGSGKYAFELLILAGTGSNSPFAAIADKSNTANVIDSYAGNTGPRFESVGYWGNARTYFNFSTGSGSVNHSGGTAVDDVITVAVDMTVPEVRFFRNGGAIDLRALPAGKTWFPVASLQQSAKVRLVTIGLTHLPAGFSEWG